MSTFKILPNVNYGRNLNDVVVGCEHFKYGDFVSSDVAVKHNIANVPNEKEWKAIEYLCINGLEPLRQKCGRLLINSGYRCHELNSHKDIGSTDKSFHRYGAASDIEPLDCSLTDLLWAAVELKGTSEIIAEYFPTGWVHLAMLKGNTNGTIKIKDATHSYTIVTKEKLAAVYPKEVRHA